MIRTGIGYDVHKLKEGIPLFIGGINIKSSLGSVGHSDGDALIHAIADSLLGAAGLGDIGNFFPSNDEKWRDAQSNIFLSEVTRMIVQKGYQISNIDSTIIIQKPKLQRFVPVIRKNIAKILNISEEILSIKATTTDNLGIIGNSKGWSVIAIATIYNNEQSNN
tara:strand:+ start:193 stop:684 length:492 start_codon:yes stop_codon:yes gene_type:complete